MVQKMAGRNWRGNVPTCRPLSGPRGLPDDNSMRMMDCIETCSLRITANFSISLLPKRIPFAYVRSQDARESLSALPPPPSRLPPASSHRCTIDRFVNRRKSTSMQMSMAKLIPHLSLVLHARTPVHSLPAPIQAIPIRLLRHGHRVARSPDLSFEIMLYLLQARLLRFVAAGAAEEGTVLSLEMADRGLKIRVLGVDVDHAKGDANVVEVLVENEQFFLHINAVGSVVAWCNGLFAGVAADVFGEGVMTHCCC